MTSQLFDLASLAKTLVTAPLALRHLDLECDRRKQLGLTSFEDCVTVSQLLSHTSGLPPWLPYERGVPLVQQLERLKEVLTSKRNPLLRGGHRGSVVYSDVGFRLIWELLEAQTGKTLPELAEDLFGGAIDGFHHLPFVVGDDARRQLPIHLPDAIDAEAWLLSSKEPLPERAPRLPHDCNARAGMCGHAGFAADNIGFEAVLRAWLAGGWPLRQAQSMGTNADGILYGYGLHRVPALYTPILWRIPLSLTGVVVLVQGDAAAPPPAHPLAPGAEESNWWMHTGFTGCAVFVRIGLTLEECLIVGLLAHRLGVTGGLLSADELAERRLGILGSWAAASF